MGEKSYHLLPIEQLSKLGNKVIHYSHHARFTNVCIELKIIPKGLKIVKKPSIRLWRESFLDKWRDKLNETEWLLLDKINEENVYNAKRCEKKFFEHLEKSNSDIEISALNNIQHNFKELEEQLFNRRITKFIKLDPSINIRELRRKMNITETSSRKLHTHCLDVAVRTKRITTKRKKVSLVGTSKINQKVNNNIQENTVNNSLNNSNTKIANNVNLTENTTSEPSQDRTLDLAKVLASLMEDDIPPAISAIYHILIL